MVKEVSVGRRLAALKDRSTLQLTTLGRKTGKRHAVTIWFLVDADVVYLVSMSMRRDWPRNLIKNGHAELKIDGSVFKGRANEVRDAKRREHVKQLLRAKYWAAWLGSWLGFGPDGAFAVTVEG